MRKGVKVSPPPRSGLMTNARTVAMQRYPTLWMQYCCEWWGEPLSILRKWFARRPQPESLRDAARAGSSHVMTGYP